MAIGPTPQYLTLPEVAERLRWSVRTLKRLLRKHGIATIGTGRLARLTQADIDEFIRRMRPAQPPPEAQTTVRSSSFNTREINKRLRMESAQREAQSGRGRFKRLLAAAMKDDLD
jgi:excisionase family DNA binding protein